MRRNAVLIGVVSGMLTSVSVMSVAALAAQFIGLPFFPFDLFDVILRVLPGPVILAGLRVVIGLSETQQFGTMDQAGKAAEQLVGLVEFLVMGAVFGALVAVIARRVSRERLPMLGMAVGVVLFVLYFLGDYTMRTVDAVVWAGTAFVIWGAGLGRLLAEILYIVAPHPGQTGLRRTRRDVLALAGAALVALLTTAIAAGAAVLRRNKTTANTAGPTRPLPSELPPGPSTAVLAARITPVTGTRSEVTSNKDFYRIDIDLIPPTLDPVTWNVVLTGLVDKPLTITLDSLRARPAVSQYVTMECISNPIGGPLTSTSLWTGVRLVDLLNEAGLRAGAQELYIEAADGFYESVYHEDMLDPRSLLVYAMNGELLTTEHGSPSRIYLPNRYGMKQPKWITRMEVLDRPGRGYWVDRGWGAQAIPQTTAVIDVAVRSGAVVRIGGIAWAGARGISKVEVQVDNGPWTAATLRTPPLSALTWVQWVYEIELQAGAHNARARAYDAAGLMQEVTPHGDLPNGATGVYSRQFDV